MVQAAPITITNPEPDCFPIISYLIIGVVYIMSFYCIYKRNVALLGALLLYIINLIFSIFITKDMLLSGRSEEIITFIIIAIFGLNTASSSLVMMTLKTLHAKYTKNNENVKLSPGNRARVSKYFAMFMCTIVFSWFLLFFYFAGDMQKPYFNYVFVGQSTSPIILVIILFLKVALSITSLGLSGYMVYLGNDLSKLKRKQLA